MFEWLILSDIFTHPLKGRIDIKCIFQVEVDGYKTTQAYILVKEGFLKTKSYKVLIDGGDLFDLCKDLEEHNLLPWKMS